MRGTKLITTLILSAFLFAGCGLKQNAVIKINNKAITQREFDKEFDTQLSNSMFARLGGDLKNNPNSIIYLATKLSVVNEVIVRTLVEEEISKRGIKVTNDDVNNEIKKIIDELGSKEQLDAALKQNGITTAHFKKSLEEQLKMDKLANQLGSSEVSEEEAKKFYKENPDKFKYPEKVRASHILISTNPIQIQEILKAKAENKKLSDEELKVKVDEEIALRKVKAEKLYNEAKANMESFAKLARENSDDTATAEKGGDLGFFATKDMVPEFSKVAFAQRPNTVSPVVKTVYGYHIILVTDRTAAGVMPYEKAKADIKIYLANQKQLALVKSLVESLKKTSNIEFVDEEYNPEVIQKKIKEITELQAKEQAKNTPKK